MLEQLEKSCDSVNLLLSKPAVQPECHRVNWYCASSSVRLPALSLLSKVEDWKALQPTLKAKDTRASNWFCVISVDTAFCAQETNEETSFPSTALPWLSVSEPEQPDELQVTPYSGRLSLEFWQACPYPMVQIPSVSL